MNRSVQFRSPLAEELQGFLKFKRALGYGYLRPEWSLREFDRFLQAYAARNRRWRFDQAALAWLSSKPQRKPISVSRDATVLRQLTVYLHRLPGHKRFPEPLWPQLPTEASFVPHSLSKTDILRLVALCADLKPPFRRVLYRTLILLLYCTGLRFGEALRLRLRDVNPRSDVLFVETSRDELVGSPFIDHCLKSWITTSRLVERMRLVVRITDCLWARTIKRCRTKPQATRSTVCSGKRD